MANLIQAAQELEFVPKQQLIQMSQDPNANYPSYLVLSEIQRRTQMEKMYAAQQPKPNTTVSEELVADFANNNTGLGAMAQSSDIPNAFQSGEMGNMAPPSPMQMMANGGRTGYQAGNLTEQETLKNQFLQGAGIDGASTQNYIPNFTKEEIEQKQGELINSGQLTENNQSFFQKRYTKDDGSIDYGTASIDGIDALLTAALVIPVAGWAVKGIGTGATLAARSALGAYRAGKFKPLTQGISNLFRKTYTRPNPQLKNAVPYGPKVGGVQPMINPKTGASVSERIFSPSRLAFSGFGAPYFLGNMASSYFGDDVEDNNQDNNQNDVSNNNQQPIDYEAMKSFLENENQLQIEQSKNKNNADMLIALGGAIGSARNPAELTSNISNAYFGLQSAEGEKQFKGLQGKLIQAQIGNIQANVAGMPLKELQNSAQIIQDGMEAGTIDRTKGMETLEIIIARISMLQNLSATGLPGGNEDPLTKAKI